MAPVPVDDPTDPNARVPTVLVVEDEAFIRFHAADLIRDYGFRVLEAADASQALRMLEDDKSVDLIFTDVTLPGELDGFGLARLLRARTPRIPVILTSGRHNEQAAREACQNDPFLAKPYDISEVVSCIRELLGHPGATGSLGVP